MTDKIYGRLLDAEDEEYILCSVVGDNTNNGSNNGSKDLRLVDSR
ncbi:hypothetical protein [Mucilaginibacter terrenus]|nr:hypothetical protein [Mucilaginibacter terrenus]